MRLVRTLGSAVLVSAVAAAALVYVDHASAQAPPNGNLFDAVSQRGNDSPCVITATAQTASPVLLLGETVSATHHVQAYCRGEVIPLHVVFVLDGTDRIERGDRKKMKDATLELATAILNDGSDYVKVGVVEFNSRARSLCQLTSVESRVIGCIRRIRAREGVGLDLGVAEGLKVLVRGRGRTDSLWYDAHEVMVVFSVGPAEDECSGALRKASHAKSQGVLLISVCVGSECDAPMYAPNGVIAPVLLPYPKRRFAEATHSAVRPGWHFHHTEEADSDDHSVE